MSTESARISAANQAQRRSIEIQLDRVRETLQAMRSARLPITYQTVARRSDVSRTFLYQNAEARTFMTTATVAADDRRRLVGRPRCPDRGLVAATSPQRRSSTESRLRQDRHPNATASASSSARSATSKPEYTDDTVQRASVENTTLKRRIRELTDETRNLGDKLRAARSNNRFLDKRFADLEVQLLIRESNSQ